MFEKTKFDLIIFPKAHIIKNAFDVVHHIAEKNMQTIGINIKIKFVSMLATAVRIKSFLAVDQLAW